MLDKLEVFWDSDENFFPARKIARFYLSVFSAMILLSWSFNLEIHFWNLFYLFAVILGIEGVISFFRKGFSLAVLEFFAMVAVVVFLVFPKFLFMSLIIILIRLLHSLFSEVLKERRRRRYDNRFAGEFLKQKECDDE